MTFLDKLTEDQRETIISLPYRAGLWVSRSDAEGGAEAEAKELQALSGIVHAFAEEMFGSEVMQHIMSATLKKKDQWPRWAEKIAAVPEDCRIAVDVIAEYGDLKDVNVFRNHLMEIGEAVALAFREGPPRRSFLATLRARIAYSASRKAGKKKSFEQFMRISPGERKALAALAESLGASY